MKNLYTPPWSSIRTIGNSRHLRKSAFLAMLVPIAAKALGSFPNPICIPVLKQTYSIDTSLPFSWKLLFVGSVLVSLGNLLFLAFCPKMVRSFANYSEFTSLGYPASAISNSYAQFISANADMLSAEKRRVLFINLCEHCHRSEDTFNQFGTLADVIEKDMSQPTATSLKAFEYPLETASGAVKNAELSFYDCYNWWDSSRTVGRLFVLGCFAASFVCFSVVVLQQILFVVSA